MIVVKTGAGFCESASKKTYPLANEFNAIWFNPGYKEMAPLMVHYLSFEKLWNKFIYLDFRAYAWWKKYLSACERVEVYP